MASSYTDLGTELMTTGENAGTWGSTTNTNLQIIEEAIRGYVAVSANSDQTLSLTDGSTGDSIRNAVIAFTGTLSANRTITVPAVEKWWIMDNQTAGAYTLTVKVSGQTGITWGASDKGTKILYGNGTDVVDTNVGGGVGGYDLNGEELILDADANTSITADTDNQIDIKIAGADDFQFTANTFTAQAGSTIAAQALTATTVTASGIVKTDDTTEATTTTDGSLQTDGGLSIAKDAVFGDDVKLLSDSAVLSFGADSDTTLTHTDGTGLTLNSTNKLLFRDSALSISSSTDGQLDIDADTEVEIATTTLDLNGALDVSGASQLSGAVTVGVDGTGLDVKFFGDTSGSFLLWDQSDDALELTDSSPIKIGDGGDMQVYHDGTNSYITNSQGALKIATESSGIAVTIGHTTSEVTIADNLTVTGTLTLGSNAELTEAELEFLDGITAGTAAASKAMVADSNIDITGGRNITISGELDAATLDISGNADIDGTTNLDAVDIDGAVQLDSTLTVGVNDTGYDVKFFGATSGAYMLWDESTDDLVLAGAAKLYLYDAAGGEYLSSSGSALTIASGSAAWELPASDGSANQVLKTDGSGNLDWTSITSATVTALNNATANELVTVGSTTTELDAEANLTFDGTDMLIGGAGKLQLRDTGLYVASNADGDLDVVSDGTAVDSINLESAGGITLDAGTAASGIIYEDDGTEMLRIHNSSSDVIVEAKVQDKDIIFKGDDGGSGVTSLTLDMSAGGIATFSAAANVAQQAITSSSNAVAWDASAKPNAYHQTSENTTLSAPTNAVEGAFICIEINFNGSHTFSWNAIFNFAADTAPTTTDTDGKTDIFVFRYNGAIWQEVGRTLNIPES